MPFKQYINMLYSYRHKERYFKKAQLAMNRFSWVVSAIVTWNCFQVNNAGMFWKGQHQEPRKRSLFMPSFSSGGSGLGNICDKLISVAVTFSEMDLRHFKKGKPYWKRQKQRWKSYIIVKDMHTCKRKRETYINR